MAAWRCVHICERLTMTNDFRRTLETKYRVRTWEGQKQGMRNAVKMLSDALRGPMESFSVLGKLGISFTRWQLFRIRFYIWLGKPGWAQAVILRTLDKT